MILVIPIGLYPGEVQTGEFVQVRGYHVVISMPYYTFDRYRTVYGRTTVLAGEGFATSPIGNDLGMEP